MSPFFLSLPHTHKKRQPTGQIGKKAVLLFVVGAVFAGVAGAASVAFLLYVCSVHPATEVASFAIFFLRLLLSLSLLLLFLFWSSGPGFLCQFLFTEQQSTAIDPLVISVLV